ncbi:MAG: hypothetical protein ACLFUO_04585 [Candidatus Woesearchaeota archaeon]
MNYDPTEIFENKYKREPTSQEMELIKNELIETLANKNRFSDYIESAAEVNGLETISKEEFNRFLAKKDINTISQLESACNTYLEKNDARDIITVFRKQGFISLPMIFPSEMKINNGVVTYIFPQGLNKTSNNEGTYVFKMDYSKSKSFIESLYKGIAEDKDLIKYVAGFGGGLLGELFGGMILKNTNPEYLDGMEGVFTVLGFAIVTGIATYFAAKKPIKKMIDKKREERFNKFSEKYIEGPNSLLVDKSEQSYDFDVIKRAMEL